MGLEVQTLGGKVVGLGVLELSVELLGLFMLVAEVVEVAVAII